MPIPKIIGQVNRVATNRVTGLFAGRLPGFGVVRHEGRRSGRQYRTPVNVFHRPGGYVIALTYGPGADWVRNVLASGGCVLELRGRQVRAGTPRVVHDESRREVPPAIRPILGLLGVTDFLHLAERSAEPRDGAAG